MKGMRSYTWMTFGLILALSSKFFDQYNTKPFFKLFFYIGILFFFIGLGKLMYEKPKREPYPRKKQPSIVNCSSCGTKNHTASNYCHMCGKHLSRRIGDPKL